jgi:hypothetical protein
MVDTNDSMIRETYRLAQDNNRMLHSMRRGAFLGGVFKVLIWGLMIGIPIWFYVVYLAPVAQSLNQSVQAVQTQSSNAQAQIKDLQGSLTNLEKSMPKLPSLPTFLNFPKATTTVQ